MQLGTTNNSSGYVALSMCRRFMPGPPTSCPVSWHASMAEWALMNPAPVE